MRSPLDESGKRVACVEACINKLCNPQNSQILLDQLNDGEYDMLQKRLGLLAFTFTASNPTGHHRFDLSKPSERECALRLVRFKNTEAQQEAKEHAACEGRVGGKRVQVPHVTLSLHVSLAFRFGSPRGRLQATDSQASTLHAPSPTPSPTDPVPAGPYMYVYIYIYIYI